MGDEKHMQKIGFAGNKNGLGSLYKKLKAQNDGADIVTNSQGNVVLKKDPFAIDEKEKGKELFNGTPKKIVSSKQDSYIVQHPLNAAERAELDAAINPFKKHEVPDAKLAMKNVEKTSVGVVEKIGNFFKKTFSGLFPPKEEKSFSALSKKSFKTGEGYSAFADHFASLNVTTNVAEIAKKPNFARLAEEVATKTRF